MSATTHRQRLTDEEKGNLFNQFRPLARHLSRRIGPKFPLIQPAALNEEAESILIRIVAEWNRKDNKGYDPAKCKPITWIYNRLHHSLFDWCRRSQSRETPISQIDSGDDRLHSRYQKTLDPEDRAPRFLEELFREISEDARILIRTIVSAPSDFVEDLQRLTVRPETALRRRQEGRGQICIKLRERHGWDSDRIFSAWQEVKAAI
jgi:hypothetical protein